MPLSGQVFVTLVTIGGYAVMKTIRRRDLRNAAAAAAAKKAAAAEKEDSVIISSNSGEQAAAEKEKEDPVVISSNSGEQGNDETKITSEVGVDDMFFSFIKTLALDTSRMAKETSVVAEIDGVIIACGGAVKFIKTLALDTSRMAKEILTVVAEMDGVVIACYGGAITFIVVEAYAFFYLLTMSSTEK